VEKVRSKTGAAVASDFADKTGTPIVIDSSVGNCYILLDNGTILNITPLAGLVLAGHAGDAIIVDGSGTGFTTSSWTRVTASQAVVQGQNYLLAGNSMTLTLPAVPSGVGPIRFLTETATLTGNVVARNGNTIMALAEDMTIDDTHHWFWELAWAATSSDWRLT